MGRQGDLLLIFADALTRSWKQVIKFRPEGAPPLRVVRADMPMLAPPEHPGEDSLQAFDGLVRDERGVSLPREGDD